MKTIEFETKKKKNIIGVIVFSYKYNAVLFYSLAMSCVRCLLGGIRFALLPEHGARSRL
jgi:hypothetical protein